MVLEVRMEYCPNCFKRTCRCGKSYKVEIDYYIYPAIYELNRKGYRTTNCCSGHEYNQIMNTYVAFSEDIIEEFVSDYWQYDSYNYRGFHERKNIIRIYNHEESKISFKKKNLARHKQGKTFSRFALFLKEARE